MIEVPGVVSDVVRSVGLATAMKAAGVVTGLLPIPQPMLLVGPGASARLGQAVAAFGHKRVMIVTDPVVSALGLHKPLLQALAAGGTKAAVFDGITADAPIPLIEQGIAFYGHHRCEAIIAFGGGSPMDAAKAIALAVANRKAPRKLVGYFRGRRAPVPLYAVPTTAGTGSEVTVAAVITDPDAKRKLVIADTRLVPLMAALDPTLMTGLPKPVTAATGMDALTHAVEAFVGQWATPHTDRMALAAVALIQRHLRRVYAHPADLAAREQMSLAATYAGLAFTRANVGYVHAIAHQLGGRYHVPHGLANAILLPHVLRFLAPAVGKRLAVLAVHMGVGRPGERVATLAKKFLAAVDALNRDLAIPGHVEALREEDIPALAKAACREADLNYPVPRYMSEADCRAILRAVLPPVVAPVKPARRGRVRAVKPAAKKAREAAVA